MERIRIGGVPTGMDRKTVRDACLKSMDLGGKPVKVAAHWLRPGWKAPMPLYVIWCHGCRYGTVTHPAGKGRVSCRLCSDGRRVWSSWKTRNYVVRPLLYALPFVLVILALILART